MHTIAAVSRLASSEAVAKERLAWDVSAVGVWILTVLGGVNAAFDVEQSRKPKPTAVSGLENEERMLVEARWRSLSTYKPRTELGMRLLKLRRRYIEAGGRLLNRDELDREIAEGRGDLE